VTESVGDRDIQEVQSLRDELEIDYRRFGLPVKVENIPEEIKELRCWVLWKASPRKGAPGKVNKRPYLPTGQAASKTNSDHWNDFATVWSAYQTGSFNGIGICLMESMGIVGIDIDNCFKDDETLNERAKTIVTKLDTYTEISPSGKGIRMLAYGRIERNFNNQNIGIELYQDRSFLTITGCIL
jgi:putative DNA primase/helicase